MSHPNLTRGGGPVGVFFSYAHEDDLSRSELHGHLASLEHGNLISRWSDRRIDPGSGWRGEVDSHLLRAQIFLALVSPDFMNSRACLLELQIAETKRKNPKDNVLVLPILIRDVSLKGSDLEEKQLLPPDRVPIERWDPRDLGWKHVADAIGKAAEDIAGRRAQIVPEATNLRKADSDFWDRTDVLESLWIQFNDRRRRIQVLTGRAGLGKRWVARRFGWERRPDYKMIWWIDAGEPIAAKEQMAALAENRGFDAAGLDRRIERLRQWLADPASGPWLLIFANAANPAAIADFLPSPVPRHGNVLVTSDDSDAWADHSPTPLGGFAVDEAVRFLIATSGDPDEVAARELAILTDGLPQSLAAASQYVRTGPGELIDYLDRIKTSSEGGVG